MKLYWKVKRGERWSWVPARPGIREVWEAALLLPKCECKTCVPGQTDGEE